MASPLNKTNLILLGLNLLLSALLWWPAAVDQLPLSGWLNRTPENQLKADVLTQLRAAEITKISLVAANRAPIELIKIDQLWWLMAPNKQLANQSKATALLKLLESPTYDRFELPTTNQPGAIVANTSEVSATFNDLTIGFGQRHPVGQRRYLILGNETALVDDYYFHHVAAPWQNWVASQTESSGPVHPLPTVANPTP